MDLRPLALLALALPAPQEPAPAPAPRIAPALAPFAAELRAGIERGERRPALESAVTAALALPAELRFELRWGSYTSKDGALFVRGAILGAPLGAVELDTRVAVDLERVSVAGLALLADELEVEEHAAFARERLHLRLAGLDALLEELVETVAEVRAAGAELETLHLNIEEAAGPAPSMRLHGVLASERGPRQAHGLRALPAELAMPRQRAEDGAARSGGGDLVIGPVETTRSLAESVASLLALERRYEAASLEVFFLTHIPDGDRFAALLRLPGAEERAAELRLDTEWLDPAETSPLEPAAHLAGARVPLAHVLDALQRAVELETADEELFALAAFAPEEEGGPTTLLVALAPRLASPGASEGGRLFELSLPQGEGELSARELELRHVTVRRGPSAATWRASLADGRGVELLSETVFCASGYTPPKQRFGARTGELFGGTIGKR